MSPDEDAVFDLINEARAAHQVQALRPSRLLSAYARWHTMKMAKRLDLYHGGLNAYLRQHNTHRFFDWGENVGASGGTLLALHAAFMRSNAHRANILGRYFSRVGVGVVRKHGIIWATQVFR